MNPELATIHAMHLRGKMYDAYRLTQTLTTEERKTVSRGPEAIENHLRKYETALLNMTIGE